MSDQKNGFKYQLKCQWNRFGDGSSAQKSSAWKTAWHQNLDC